MLDGKLAPAFERNNIPVVIAFSNLYAPYAGVFLQSLLDHAGEDNNYDIIIFEREVSKENKRLLKSLASGHTNVSIRFFDPTAFWGQLGFDYEDDAHFWPVEVYYKIIAPHILRYSGRIITVDTDTLLMEDIARLMDEDLGGCSVGGVCDVAINGAYLRNDIAYTIKVNIRDYVGNVLKFSADEFRNYVNSGLLLYDCDKYAQELDMKTFWRTVGQNRYAFRDQDVLNILMKGRIKCLDFSWNVVLPLKRDGVQVLETGSKLYGGAYERACENPYLLHWAGRPKPWVCPDVPYGNEWWQTALRTPFVGHIIARMTDAQEQRRTYYRERYGKEVDIWDPAPKQTDSGRA